jgi:2-keto-3-deoxy-L-rhamnonate aldolase RhmA
MGLKAMTKRREAKFGHFVVEFATPGIGHLLRAAGCDFVLFDMEHSGFGHETVKSAVRYFEAAGVPVVVRAPSREPHHVARTLDMGAEGIMVPMVGTAEDARRLVAAVKYAPDGERGVALGIAHDAYEPGEVMAKLAAANARTTVFALIETAEGIDNVEAIAAVPGLDCLWVGHFDLTASMGIPGEFGDPRFTGALARVHAAARANGLAFGRLVPDVEAGRAAFAEGFDVLCYSGDVWLYQAALADGIGRLRAACTGAAR